MTRGEIMVNNNLNINLNSTVIRPKRIYFPEHFCCCFSSNLCVLNTTNMVSRFCAKIQLSVKIWENIAKNLFHQKSHGARRRDGEGLGGRHTTRWHGPGLTVPGCGEGTPAALSSPPSAYIYPLT
jgi:hypothetical protein